MARNYVIILLT